jgi:hypothetical protein
MVGLLGHTAGAERGSKPSRSLEIANTVGGMRRIVPVAVLLTIAAVGAASNSSSDS